MLKPCILLPSLPCWKRCSSSGFEGGLKTLIFEELMTINDRKIELKCSLHRKILTRCQTCKIKIGWLFCLVELWHPPVLDPCSGCLLLCNKPLQNLEIQNSDYVFLSPFQGSAVWTGFSWEVLLTSVALAKVPVHICDQLMGSWGCLGMASLIWLVGGWLSQRQQGSLTMCSSSSTKLSWVCPMVVDGSQNIEKKLQGGDFLLVKTKHTDVSDSKDRLVGSTAWWQKHTASFAICYRDIEELARSAGKEESLFWKTQLLSGWMIQLLPMDLQPQGPRDYETGFPSVPAHPAHHTPHEAQGTLSHLLPATTIPKNKKQPHSFTKAWTRPPGL